MKLKTLLELPEKIKEEFDTLKNMFNETNNKLIKLNEKIEKLEKFYKIEQTVSSLSDEQQWIKEQQEKKEHSSIDYLYAN